jgi:hypothetical protein
MRREALSDAATTRLIDEFIEPILQMPAGDGDAMARHRALVPPVAHSQRLLEDRTDPRREGAFPMIADKDATATQEMRETRLMHGVAKSALRRPAVADQDAIAKPHSHCRCPPTFQPVSSGATTGLPRIVAHKA